MDLHNTPSQNRYLAPYVFVEQAVLSVFLKHFRGVLYCKFAAFANFMKIYINNVRPDRRRSGRMGSRLLPRAAACGGRTRGWNGQSPKINFRWLAAQPRPHYE